MSNGIMDNPGDAKYGFTHEQIIEGFKILKEKGAIPAFAVIAPLLVSYLFLLLIYFMTLL